MASRVIFRSAVRFAATVLVASVVGAASAAASAPVAVLAHPATGRCLDANVHQGVFLNTCNNGAYQNWSARKVSGTTVTLVSGGTQRCLDANSPDAVVLDTCNGGREQEWETQLVSVATVGSAKVATVSLVNVATSRCLDANIHQGVFLNACNTLGYQRWQVKGSWAFCLVDCSSPPASKSPSSTSPAPTSSPPATTSPSSLPTSSSSTTTPSAPPPVAPVTSTPPLRHAPRLARKRRARVSLKATPRSLRNGQTVRLRGRVSAVRVPRGTVVLVQAHSGRKWITFGWALVHAKGSFELRYRFTRTTGRQTYLMRAELPTQYGYRAKMSLSKTLRVKVTGPR